MNVTLSLPELGLSHVSVHSLSGVEALGRAYHFEISLRSAPPEGALGSVATLHLGARSIPGIVAAVSSEPIAGSAGARLTLVPRLSLLGLGKRSRAFDRMSTPDIVTAVVGASDVAVAVELRLDAAYAARPLTVQHRESDLDFVLRLLEREGITALVRHEGEQEVLLLCDHNGALPDRGAVLSSDLRSESKLLPRRVELFGLDPERPSLPLRASAIVSERGVGALEVHDESFRTPEDGPRVAALAAERLRCQATTVKATLAEPSEPGLLRVDDWALCAIEVEHRFAEGAWQSRVKAIPANVPFRPARTIAEPKIVGVSTGQIAPRSPAATAGEPSLLKVREHAFGSSDRGMAMAAGSDSQAELAEGTPVLWGCVDGDPERPVITSIAGSQPGSPHNERVLLRTKGGATMELSGGIPLGTVEGTLDGSIPAPAHHTTPAGHATDTYLRFAIPHGSGWSYIRAGESASGLTSPSAFDEKTQYDTITRKGYAEELGNSWTDNAPGFFDYTDGARTQITRGDWEKVVGGTGRLAINGGGTTPNYELIVGANLAFTKADTPQWTYSTGAKGDYYGGLKVEAVVGAKADLMLGGKASVDVGFMVGCTAGYKFDFVFADSFEIRKGEELGLSTTIDKRAKDKIQYSIESSAAADSIDKGTYIAAAIAVVGAGLATAAGEVARKYSDNDTYSSIASGALGLIYAITFGAMRAKSTERDLTDGDPILSLDKPNKLAALRSDDWCLLLTQSAAVLGKNEPYATKAAVTDLTKANAEAAIIIEEGGKLTLQSDKTQKTKFFIQNDTLLIKNKTVTIEATNIKIKGDVEIDGKLTVKKAGEFSDTLTVKGTGVKVT